MKDGFEFYKELERHLLTLKRPSEYLKAIEDAPELEEYPYSMLGRLRHTKQSPRWHPEGSVWNHTLMVIDEAAAYKHKSRDPDALMWAALLHDIGKPDTTKVRKQKVTSYGHDKLGAALAAEFLLEFDCDRALVDRVCYLVYYHMQVLFVVNGMKLADISSMARNGDIREVALLGLCDRLGRQGSDILKEKHNISVFLDKCQFSQ